MLKIIDSKDTISTDSALDLYPDCKIVMTDFDYDKLSGRVYAISTSQDTTEELTSVRLALENEGNSTASFGNYEGGGCVGVLYGIEEEPI